MAGKLERPEKPESAPIEKDQSFGEALEEMGFLPVPGAKRRLIRQERPSKPLTRWKEPGKREDT
ncbi:hypothetical protein [Microvirga sp. P5_D2]